eukprot:2132772-Prymnesium_polylepis.2
MAVQHSAAPWQPRARSGSVALSERAHRDAPAPVARGPSALDLLLGAARAAAVDVLTPVSCAVLYASCAVDLLTALRSRLEPHRAGYAFGVRYRVACTDGPPRAAARDRVACECVSCLRDARRDR